MYRAAPYLLAATTAALLVGGAVGLASADEPASALARLPDDPQLVWDIRVDEAQWAVGDDEFVYIASPSTTGGDTLVTVWDRDTGASRSRFTAQTPEGDSPEFSAVVNGVLLDERCTYGEVISCELVATDVTDSRVLWKDDTAEVQVGLVGNEVALGSESSFQLIDPRTGAAEGRIVGDSVSYDNLRSVVTVENSGVVEAFRLPDLDNPVAAATLPSDTSVYALVGDDLVVGDGRDLSVSDGDELRLLRRFDFDIAYLEAGSDEIVLVSTVGVTADDGSDDETVALADLHSSQGRRLWSRSVAYVGVVHGKTGSAIFQFNVETVPFLDQWSGNAIVASAAGYWRFGADGLLLVERERVRAFDYMQQNIVWTLSSVSESSNVSLIDRGVVVLDTDGRARLYQ